MAFLSQKNVEWAIDSFVKFADTDIFPKAFEYNAISHCRDDILKMFTKQDICQWQTRPFRRCLVPKQRYGFRLATQLDPLDMLFYTALILEVGDLIEESRLSKQHNICFSNRFSRNDSAYVMFDDGIGYPEFQKRCWELVRNHKFVVVTDIADFYPRIYFHRLENALNSVTKTLPTHVKAITQLIKGWNQNVSYGLPIGSDPSRLLAEIVIDDVDRILFSENMVFVRYVDDYRIFCNTKLEAYQALTRLANVVYETNGLTLQSHKTRILSADEFVNEILRTEIHKELDALAKNFADIIAKLGVDDPYNNLDYDLLSIAQQREIDGLNLEGLLDKQISAEEIDIAMTRFLINRLGLLKRIKPLTRILASTEKLYPVFTEVIRYIARLTEVLGSETRNDIGKQMLINLKGSVVSHLEFHRMQIMSLFAGSTKWGNADKLAGFYNIFSDNWFRRTLLVALGKSDQHYWLRAKKTEMEQMPIWEKRAFLYAASCFSKDERVSYYRAVKTRLDDLDKYVIDWADKNSISS